MDKIDIITKAGSYVKKTRGMTLVEVMVSIMLITLLTGSILGVVIENIKLGETLEYNYAAINIAKSEMDRIRELRRDFGYGVLSDIAGESAATVTVKINDQSEASFTRTTTINTAFSTNLTEVTVSVSYKRTGDVNATVVTLKSLLSPYL